MYLPTYLPGQISGFAMGTKMGSSYAYFFMGHLEHLVRHTYPSEFPETFKRYIDDSVRITEITRDKLEKKNH